jgi:hypothetical protein
MFASIYKSANLQNIAKHIVRAENTGGGFVRSISKTSDKKNSDYTPVYEERALQPKTQFLKLKKPSR